MQYPALWMNRRSQYVTGALVDPHGDTPNAATRDVSYVSISTCFGTYRMADVVRCTCFGVQSARCTCIGFGTLSTWHTFFGVQATRCTCVVVLSTLVCSAFGMFILAKRAHRRSTKQWYRGHIQ